MCEFCAFLYRVMYVFIAVLDIEMCEFRAFFVV